MKPIIFSTLMVQAILDGRKTQTRRVIKLPKGATDLYVAWGVFPCYPSKSKIMPEKISDEPLKEPYKPGDILWVRETFCEVPYEHNHVPIKGGYITIPKYAYKADSERDYTGIWKPSIHMPREAARIFLRVTNVKAERLQDITDEDAIAEGMSQILVDGVVFISAKGDFHVFWDALNIKRGYGWDTNPWVWVVEFERISKDEAYKKEGLKC